MSAYKELAVLAFGGCDMDKSKLITLPAPSTHPSSLCLHTLMPSPEDPLWALPQAQLPLTNPVLRLQVSQREETSLPSPMGLWCNQQGSTCLCLDVVEHEAATVTALPPARVQEGPSACACRPDRLGASRARCIGLAGAWHPPPRRHTVTA